MNGGEVIRVVTWNLRSGWSVDRRSLWPARRARVAAVLAELDADLWGFQEVFAFQRRWLLQRGLPGRAWAHAGDGRNRWRRGEAVPIAWRTDRLSLDAHGTRWFGPTPHRPGSSDPEAAAPRVLTWASGTTAGGRRLTVFDTHLDDRSGAARQRAGEQVRSWMAEHPDVPVVVMGDLNATEDDADLRTLFDAGLTSVLPADAPPTATAFETEAGRRLDHILVSDHWSVRSAAVWTRAATASDHYPIVADLELL